MSDKMTASDTRNRLRRALDMLAALPVEEAQRMLATLPVQQREAVLAARVRALQTPVKNSSQSAPARYVNTPAAYVTQSRMADNHQTAKRTPACKTPASILLNLPVEPLAACLMRESAEIIALVLRSLEPQSAQAIAMRLPDELGSAAAIEMAHLTTPAPGVLQCITQALREDVQRYVRRQEERVNGIKCIARTLLTAQQEVALEALLELGQRDAELALAVSNELVILRDNRHTIQKPVDLETKPAMDTLSGLMPLSEAAA